MYINFNYVKYSIFATTFLGVEMITKLFATVVYLALPTGGMAAPLLVFSLYTVFAVYSCRLISGKVLLLALYYILNIWLLFSHELT